MLLQAMATLRRDPNGALPEAGLDASYRIGGIDSAHVAKFQKIVNGRGAHPPLAYFYLAAQRAQVALMLDRRFPYAIPGLIHAANAMRLHRVPLPGAYLEADVSVKPQHDGGNRQKIVFDVELTQFGSKVVDCASEYRVGRAGGDTSAGTRESAEQPVLPSLTTWEITASLIRRYALVSNDYNPIHLSSGLARIFGFRSAIAHGMYSAARSAAEIERRTGREVTAMTAQFRRPICLPCRVNFGLEAGIDDGIYAVSSGQRQSIHVCGRCMLA